MNPLAEIALIVSRELRKNLRSVKGIILFALSLLGGTAISLLLLKLEELRRAKLGDMPPEGMRALREEAYAEVFHDPEMGKYLASARVVHAADGDQVLDGGFQQRVGTPDEDTPVGAQTQGGGVSL